MLKKILLVAIVAIPTGLFAQQRVFISSDGFGSGDTKFKNPETIIGQVLYDFTYIPDTTQPDKPQKEVVALDFSNDYSKFYSQTYNISDSLMRADIKKQIEEQQGGGNVNINVTHTRGGTPDVFLTDKKEDQVERVAQSFRGLYLISNGKHAINWDIQDSTKTIGGYTCQKAVGMSRGREYIAWFTTDLPYSFGPRRLNGLPGLILEAYDVSNRIVYTFKQYSTGSGKEIGIPENGIASTEKEYDDMQAAIRANPQAYINANIPQPPPGAGGGSEVSIRSVKVEVGAAVGPGNKKVINFPIDLANDK
jgi:GLPGLI family protein